ncbi:hypothetical protein LXA43DRAFT_906615 [Ganoderma leucocontextum]|nr:hypothetical protein LXA43DRAFT_906615 [Ganoderma leucocontextum]
MTADNCCQVRNTAQKVFPELDVVQDVWHFLMRHVLFCYNSGHDLMLVIRYVVCIKDGAKNPHRAEVANDIVDAILKVRAANGVPAMYRPQAEQEERLVQVYNKWKEQNGVWTAAASNVHAKQLAHVQKGCLARPRDDIATDGSRIEGSHKGWNSIMRSFASGLEVMNALGHDHVLRHNVRLDMQDDTLDQSMFMYHTHGSHHIRLTNSCMKLWNRLVEAQSASRPLPANIRTLPELRPADSREKFGLVKMSTETATQYSLTTIKQEPGDETNALSLPEVLDADRILEGLGVDPALLNVPQVAEPPPKQLEDTVPGGGLSPAEWGVPTGWFPATQAIGLSSRAAVPSTSTSATPGSSAILQPGTLASTPSTSNVVPQPSAPASTSSSVLQPSASTSSAVLQPGTLVSTPSTLSALPQPSAPASTSSAVLQPGASTSSDVLQPGALASSSSITSITAAGTSASLDLDGPPPKKKTCLTVPGMPPPLKSRRGGSMQGVSSSSKTTHVQRGPQNNRGTLDALFAQMTTATTATTATTTTTLPPMNLTPTNEPCLPSPAIVGLTRSQRLFSVVTQVDPRSLTFGKGGSSHEFYLFMELRVTHQWATFQMSPYDWVCAASTYNTGIRKLNLERGTTFPLKTPRALLDKLSDVEAKIFSRIRDKNYQSRSGQTYFWEHHCKAVYLGSKVQRMVDDDTFKMGKNHICGRCKRIMYPEGKNHKDNHGRNVCSDGVRQSSEKVHFVINDVSHDLVEHPPPFPQPNGIFTDGNVFHPARFMEVVRRFYDRVVIDHSAPGALAMNDYAFAALLYDRTVIVPGLDGRPSKVIFKLFHSFKLAPGEPVVLDEHEGEMYLRMDCLSEPALEVIQDGTAVGGLGAPEGAGLA